ncbi:MAG: TRAP transporter substrate-binding protein DctP [Chloroflexi bacterium]|nr:TRAP transporter substrate-binding protein DctP [Chloroflexota bacterium]
MYSRINDIFSGVGIGKYLMGAMLCVLIGALAACGGGGEVAAPAGSGDSGAGAAAPQPTAMAAAPASTGGGTQLETQGQSFEFQLVCINRSVAACELVNSFFVPEVAKRTDGQLQFVISSFPELGIAGGDTLRLVADNTLEVTEIYSGYVGGDLPLLDIGNLWGLSPSEEAHLELSDAIHEDLIQVLKDTTGGQPIMRQYYPNQFIFSRDELDALEQFDGKQIRQHSTILGDLLAGLGAEGQFVAFADVYTALERGVLDGGVTGGEPGHSQRWYEVTDYLYGPIVGSVAVAYYTMSSDSWNQIPPDMQQIVLEVGREYEELARKTLIEEWNPFSVSANVESGMIHRPFSDEVQAKMREVALNTILPNWVERTGGPNSDAVQLFNEKVAPIIGVAVNPDGTAKELDGAMMMEGKEEAKLVSQGEDIEIQLVCINRTGNPCTLIYSTEEQQGIDGFIERVRDRTEGQVEFQISSFPELGLAGPDSLRLIEDRTMELAEIYSGYIGGDLPIIDVANLWGLYPDSETNFAVIDVTRDDVHRIIEEQSHGIVIMENYYESNYYFSSRPLNTLEDFKGLKTRSHSTVLSDLLSGMGADPQFMAFADVYTGLERGVLDAAVSCGTCGSGVRWYEVTDYMVGPIVAIGVTWITMNKDVWDSIPPDLQAIIKEEGDRHQRTSRDWVETIWAQEGIDENTEGGMEYIEFSQDIKDALFQAGRNNVLPRWVERTGGPNSEAVQIYNEKAAPIIGVRVGADGQAEDIK